MKPPQPTTTAILSLSESVREECMLAALPDKTDAEKARLALLQTANALSRAGQDETKHRAHGRINPHGRINFHD